MLSFYLSMLETEEEKSVVTEIFNNYEQALYRAAFKLLSNRYDAEDAVHEAFLRIVKNISKISEIPRDERGRYSVIIVRNVAIDMLNRKKKNAAENIDDCYDLVDGVGLEDEALSRIGGEQLKKELSKLSERDYEVLYMSLILEYSSAEIAAALGINAHTASQRVYRAKAKLKERLEMSEYDR